MIDDKLYRYSDYKAVLNAWLDEETEAGRRGGVARMAAFLNVHSSFVSQVLKRDKDLSSEQAFKLTDFLGLTGLAKDYFLLLFQEGRAGSHDLQRYYARKLTEIRQEAKKVRAHLGDVSPLSDAASARFYSEAIYSQLRLMTSIERFNTAEKLAETLKLPLVRINETIGFLLTHGLIARNSKGELKIGVSRTHLGSDSPLIHAHHRNWRLKAIDFHGQMDDTDLAFSAPLTVSRHDFEKIRERLLAVIKELSSIVGRTEREEEFVVFNLDWLRLH